MPSYDHLADEYLFAVYVEGNEPAFAALLARYERSLFRYLYRLIGQHHAAEDLLQETFVRVVQHAWRFKPGFSFRTWLYTIATNLARNELRKRRRKGQLRVMEKLPPVFDPAPEPLEAMSEREIQQHLHQQLAQCLAALDADQQTLFVLRMQEGLSYEEIGQIVNCKPATARKRMFIVMTKLREYVNDPAHEGRGLEVILKPHVD